LKKNIVEKKDNVITMSSPAKVNTPNVRMPIAKEEPKSGNITNPRKEVKENNNDMEEDWEKMKQLLF
jgi:hypothetical protein